MQGAPIDYTFYLSSNLSSNVCSIVFGKYCNYEDKCFQRLVKMINESFVETSKSWAQIFTIPQCGNGEAPQLLGALPAAEDYTWEEE
ncbi:hypothetical protein U0070_016184 [Myodes glareolus]|uniref:Uncharacterized protein n=1 Tax=Myodes glareolus TaxID=447135 RepID=A0AAW0HRC0_MYOGA